tara:strand:+ start:700 stop:897 length:198 start_codon:yes stop_codon:yes gene_type:complete
MILNIAKLLFHLKNFRDATERFISVCHIPFSVCFIHKYRVGVNYWFGCIKFDMIDACAREILWYL